MIFRLIVVCGVVVALMRAGLRRIAMQRMHGVGIILTLIVLVLIILARIVLRLRGMVRRRLPYHLRTLDVRTLYPLRRTGRGRRFLFDRLLISLLVLLTRRLGLRRIGATRRCKRVCLADQPGKFGKRVALVRARPILIAATIIVVGWKRSVRISISHRDDASLREAAPTKSSTNRRPCRLRPTNPRWRRSSSRRSQTTAFPWEHGRPKCLAPRPKPKRRPEPSPTAPWSSVHHY